MDHLLQISEWKFQKNYCKNNHLDRGFQVQFREHSPQTLVDGLPFSRVKILGSFSPHHDPPTFSSILVEIQFVTEEQGGWLILFICKQIQYHYLGTVQNIPVQSRNSWRWWFVFFPQVGCDCSLEGSGVGAFYWCPPRLKIRERSRCHGGTRTMTTRGEKKRCLLECCGKPPHLPSKFKPGVSPIGKKICLGPTSPKGSALWSSEVTNFEKV